MNVPFVTGSEELDAEFVKEAAAAGFVNLKGHRSVGGMRACGRRIVQGFIFRVYLVFKHGGRAREHIIRNQILSDNYDNHTGLDESSLFQGTVRKEDRSLMNVPFVTGSEELDAEFGNSVSCMEALLTNTPCAFAILSVC